MSDPPRPPPTDNLQRISYPHDALINVCLIVIMALAGLVFAGSLMSLVHHADMKGLRGFPGFEVDLESLADSIEQVVGAILGMGFSAVVFALSLVGVILVDIRTELRLLTERKRKRLEAERRAAYQAWLARREADAAHQAWLAEEEKRQREQVDPEAMQIGREDVTAQRSADRRQRREIWRGRWARFWNGVRKRITRILGEENEILVRLVFGIVKTLVCIAPFWAIAAAAIVAWSLLSP